MSCTITKTDELQVDDLHNEEQPSDCPMSSRAALISGSVISLIDQIVVSGCTFLTMYLVSHNCTKTQVGAFALAATVVNFTRTVQERIIAAPYLAFVYHPLFSRRSFRGSSFVHQAVFSVAVTTLVLATVAIGWWLNLESPLLYLTASLAITIPLMLVRDQIRAVSAADFQFVSQLMLDLAVGVSQISAFLVLVWIGRFSIASVNVAIGLACLLPALVWFFTHRQLLEVDRTKLLSDWNHNWRYSRWLVGARVLGIFGYLAIPWMVAYFLDNSATGAFAVCSSLVGISLMFVTGLNNLFQPRTIRELQRSGIKGMNRTLVESILIVTGVLTTISIGFAFFGSFALATLFGAAYREYGNVAFLLSLSTLSVSFSVLFGNGLAALGNSREYFWGEFACCVCSVTAAIVLIPIWGLAGAAGSLILGGMGASLVTGLTLIRAIKHYSPIRRVPEVNLPPQVPSPFHQGRAKGEG